MRKKKSKNKEVPKENSAEVKVQPTVVLPEPKRVPVEVYTPEGRLKVVVWGEGQVKCKFSDGSLKTFARNQVTPV